MKKMLPHSLWGRPPGLPRAAGASIAACVLALSLFAARHPALRDPQHPLWREPAPAVYRVRLETTAGVILLEAHREWAPIGADRFYNLVRSGFYDDSRFFRVTARFAQFGIAGDPATAAVWRERSIPDDPVKQTNTRGRFAFAMTGPDARTTQIYICKTDMSSQDKDGFAPLGTVVDGMDVVDALYAGYGESAGGGMRAGRQGRIFAEGNPHLDRDFPKLDKLIRAVVLP
ncbi:MAG TPA: peptidylprolyl isomerase [Candidatus Acidoferrales bacterium]|nr:peptidylprolyl isomerase [Candidatus Acidoferrales bacterium]